MPQGIPAQHGQAITGLLAFTAVSRYHYNKFRRLKYCNLEVEEKQWYLKRKVLWRS